MSKINIFDLKDIIEMIKNLQSYDAHYYNQHHGFIDIMLYTKYRCRGICTNDMNTIKDYISTYYPGVNIEIYNNDIVRLLFGNITSTPKENMPQGRLLYEKNSKKVETKGDILRQYAVDNKLEIIEIKLDRKKPNGLLSLKWAED